MLFNKNRSIIPPNTLNIIITLLLILLPAILDAAFIQFNYVKAEKIGLFIPLVLYIFTAYKIIKCGFTEPGLIPNNWMY